MSSKLFNNTELSDIFQTRSKKFNSLIYHFCRAFDFSRKSETKRSYIPSSSASSTNIISIKLVPLFFLYKLEETKVNSHTMKSLTV